MVAAIRLPGGRGVLQYPQAQGGICADLINRLCIDARPRVILHGGMVSALRGALHRRWL